MRAAACFGAALEVIEPCGFPLTDKGVRRAAMDYEAQIQVTRHSSWNNFLLSDARNEGRLVLFTTKIETSIWDFSFAPSDLLLFGRESAGVPDEVRVAADAAVRIPLAPTARSLNLVVACGIGLAVAGRSAQGAVALAAGGVERPLGADEMTPGTKST